MARDLRRYARQTNARLIAGGLLLVFIVGDGLIYLIYGRNAALTGFVCLLFGLAPLVLVWAGLSLMEWVVKRADRD
jgi:TM2 domain-containing membrane protein YozV